MPLAKRKYKSNFEGWSGK